MPIETSNKVILITEKPRITTPIKIALDSLGLEFTTDYPALTSLPLMRTGIAKSGKTAFIRTELLRFIKEIGYPRAIIMDSLIDLGPGSIQDADMMKIFKTFLIAYVILRKGSEHKNIRGNFILLTKGKDFEKKFGIGGNPHSVINLLSTQNPEINLFIDELKEDRGHFDSVFSITVLDTDTSSDIITDTVSKFLAGTAKGAPVKSPDNNTDSAPVT